MTPVETVYQVESCNISEYVIPGWNELVAITIVRLEKPFWTGWQPANHIMACLMRL